jgi:hypothetical protein
MAIMVTLNGKLLYKKNLKERTCKVEKHFTQEFTYRKIYVYSDRTYTSKLSIRYVSTRNYIHISKL